VARRHIIPMAAVLVMVLLLAGIVALSRARLRVPPQGTMSPAEYGAVVYQTAGCVACHSVDGRVGIGPTLMNLYGYERMMNDRQLLVADEAYLRRSILEHSAEVVAGYGNVGPSLAGKLEEPQIAALVEYIISLSDCGEPTKQDESSDSEPHPG
jgi:mono/diheme cytochrome c family protein